MARELENWQDLYQKLDALVVAGAHGECRKILRTFQPTKIPREWAPQFGELGFRVQDRIYTLKTLHRFIHPENSFAEKATDKEKVIYASALLGLGAINEAQGILNQIKVDEEPEALFYGAGVHFYDWNYPASLPLLKKYISSEKISSYRRLVGKINLAAAAVQISDWKFASDLLDQIIVECETQSYILLLGNCFELQAQIQLYQGFYDQALGFLEKARGYLKDQKGLYSLFVEKWSCICLCLKTKSHQELQNLRNLRSKAHEAGHWISVRECDLFEAMVTRNPDLVRKLIMGSPAYAYRQRVRKLYGENINAKGRYFWLLGDSGESDSTDCTPSVVFDPYEKSGGSEALFEKPLLLSLFSALTEDFYKPCHLGLLFQKIYPEEKFNPFTSPARVLQLLRRLNHWFADNQAPIKVAFKKSEFRIIRRLSEAGSVGVVIQRGKSLSTMEGKTAQLQAVLKEKSFSAVQVSEVLGISLNSAREIISQNLHMGKLLSQGRGRSLRYNFSVYKSRKQAA